MGASTFKYNDRYQVRSFKIEDLIDLAKRRLTGGYRKEVPGAIPADIVERFKGGGYLGNCYGDNGGINRHEESSQV